MPDSRGSELSNQTPTGSGTGRGAGSNQKVIKLANPQSGRRRKGTDRGGLRAGAGLYERRTDCPKRTLAGAAQRCGREDQIRLEQRARKAGDARIGSGESSALAD